MLKYEFAVIIGCRANTIAAIASKELLSVFDWVINGKALRTVVIRTATKDQAAIGAGFKEGDTPPRPNAHAVTVGYAIPLFVRAEICDDLLGNPTRLANELCSVGSRAAKLTNTLAISEYFELNKFYLFHNL